MKLVILAALLGIAGIALMTAARRALMRTLWSWHKEARRIEKGLRDVD